MKPHVVFVCVENSNRSQMAEGFARLHGAHLVEAYSSGSRPSGVVNPKAIAAMKEKGVDLTVHASKALHELPDVEWEWAITMGCGDECPMLRARHRTDWALPDPKHLEPEAFNQVRDQIEQRVLELLRRVEADLGCVTEPS
jgi:arsenate reductase